MSSSLRIAAVVVVYNPGADLFRSLSSYAGQVDELIVVDNSEPPSPELPGRLPPCLYLPQHRNVGVARALNIGAGKAMEHGFPFLLTMDQDSFAPPDMVVKLVECLQLGELEKIGLVAPFHLTGGGGRPPAGIDCQPVMTPMTSGCLLNLAAYREAGPFREDFFIDFVDNEYCLRLRSKGFKVLRANRALLEHQVGETRKYGPFVATNHSPLRRYYKTRNRFLVNRLYRRAFHWHCFFDRVRLVKEVASILLFEGEKMAKLRMMWRGYLDYRRGRFGRYGDAA